VRGYSGLQIEEDKGTHWVIQKQRAAKRATPSAKPGSSGA
jgi:hypothetical protein